MTNGVVCTLKSQTGTSCHTRPMCRFLEFCNYVDSDEHYASAATLSIWCYCYIFSINSIG